MLNSPNKFSFIICDDDPEDQNMIVEAIKAIDITIEYTSVYNGNQLIDLLSNKGVYRNNSQAQADAVILDINMPVMDGLTALTEIKNNDLLKEVPIFILNTSRGEDHTLKCRDLGVAGIYMKP